MSPSPLSFLPRTFLRTGTGADSTLGDCGLPGRRSGEEGSFGGSRVGMHWGLELFCGSLGFVSSFRLLRHGGVFVSVEEVEKKRGVCEAAS